MHLNRKPMRFSIMLAVFSIILIVGGLVVRIS
jgi:hypothetical protein